MLRWMVGLVMVWMLIGCEERREPVKPYDPALEKAKLQMQHELEMAKLKMQQERAVRDDAQAVEMGKLDQTVQLRSLELEHAQKLEAIKQASAEADKERAFAQMRNLMILSAILLLIIAYGLYVLFKYRHADKLRAYNDNLEKYFEQQERQSRMKLAEKIIDTIADGRAEHSEQKKLLEILHGVQRDDTPGQIEFRNGKDTL